MTSNHVPLILAIRMTLRMTLVMTFKKWDFRGYPRRTHIEGDLDRDFKQDLRGDLLSSSGQVQVRFNSLELLSYVHTPSSQSSDLLIVNFSIK